MADLKIKISTEAELAGARQTEQALERQIGKAKALGKDYKELSDKLAQVRAKMAEYVPPADAATKSTEKFGATIGDVSDKLGKKFVGAAALATAAFRALGTIKDIVAPAFEGVSREWERLKAHMQESARETGKSAGPIRLLETALSALSERIESDFLKALDKIPRSLGTMADKFKEATRAAKDLKRAQDELDASLKTGDEALDRKIAGIDKDERAKLEDLDRQERLAQARNDLIADPDARRRAKARTEAHFIRQRGLVSDASGRARETAFGEAHAGLQRRAEELAGRDLGDGFGPQPTLEQGMAARDEAQRRTDAVQAAKDKARGAELDRSRAIEQLRLLNSPDIRDVGRVMKALGIQNRGEAATELKRRIALAGNQRRAAVAALPGLKSAEQEALSRVPGGSLDPAAVTQAVSGIDALIVGTQTDIARRQGAISGRAEDAGFTRARAGAALGQELQIQGTVAAGGEVEALNSKLSQEQSERERLARAFTENVSARGAADGQLLRALEENTRQIRALERRIEDVRSRAANSLRGSP